jgi:hypothetical protein
MKCRRVKTLRFHGWTHYTAIMRKPLKLWYDLGLRKTKITSINFCVHSTVPICNVSRPDSGTVKADGRNETFKKSLFANIALNFKSRNLLVTYWHYTSRWNEVIFEFLSRPTSKTIAFIETNPILSMHFEDNVKYLYLKSHKWLSL